MNGRGRPRSLKISKFLFFVGQATPPAGWARNLVQFKSKVRLSDGG
jgi:hypothetical protein